MAIDETKLLMTPADDIEHLRAWIIRFCGLDFPNHTVSRFANSNPMEFIWTVYRAIMDGKPLSLLGLAGRDSFKTLALSVIDILSFLHDQRKTVHIGMTSAQAQRARAYLEQYIMRNDVLRKAVIKQNTKEITLNIDNHQVGMELLGATPKAVQGAHCSLLTFDEVASSMEPSNIKAYRDAAGIVGSGHNGKPGVTVKITSRQTGYSLAEEELRNASESGLTVFKWTTLDATERCPDTRSGTIPTPLWVNALTGDKFTDDEYVKIPAARQDGFTRTTDTFDKCHKCPIAALCQGDLKKQTSKSPLLRKIDDVINKIRLSGSWDWAVAQIMSLKPSSEGLVYFEFDRQKHAPGWDHMWKVLTNEDPTQPVTRESFVEELKKRGAHFYAGIDWGWSSPSTCVVMAVDRREICYVVEAMGRTYTSDPEFIELIRTTIQKNYDVQTYYPDIANGSGNSLLRQAGLPTTDEIDKSISKGINVVKGMLRVPGSNGETRLYFAPDLSSKDPKHKGMLDEMELYHKKIDASGKLLDNDDPADEYNHYCDALRYMCMKLFGEMRLKVGTDYYQGAAIDNSGQSNNIPNLNQIAREHGLVFTDNRDDDGDDNTPKPDGGGGPSGALWAWT